MKIKNVLATFIFCLLFCTVIYSCTKSGSTGSTGGSGYTGGTGGTGVTPNTVSIKDMSYSPATITVKVGTTVKWTNSDAYSMHTVTSDDGTTFKSGNIVAGSSFSFTPTTTGTFLYHCTLHGGMTGTLTVTN